MSDAQREMTLAEWVDRLAPSHRARKELAELEAEVERLRDEVSRLLAQEESYSNRHCEHLDRIAELETALAKEKDEGYAVWQQEYRRAEDAERERDAALGLLREAVDPKFKPFGLKPPVTEEWDDLVDRICKMTGCSHGADALLGGEGELCSVCSKPSVMRGNGVPYCSRHDPTASQAGEGA